MSELKSVDYGLDEYIPWDLITNEDGGFDPKNIDAANTIWQKDHSFLAVYRVAGVDDQTLSVDDLSYQVETLNRFLMQMGTGWMMQFDVLRRETPDYPTSTTVTNLPIVSFIQEHQQVRFCQDDFLHQNQLYLSLTFRASRSMSGGQFVADTNYRRVKPLKQLCQSFNKKLTELLSMVGGILAYQRLTGEDLLTYLHTTLTGLNQHYHLIHDPAGLSHFLSSQDWWPNQSRIGELYYSLISITGLPRQTGPFLLSFLNNLNLSYRWNQRYILYDRDRARKKLSDTQSKFFTQRGGVLGVVRRAMRLDHKHTYYGDEKEKQASNVAEAKELLDAGDLTYGLHSNTLVFYDRDKQHLEDETQTVLKEIRKRDLICRLETITPPVFLGTLPGNSYFNPRKYFYNTYQVSDMLPVNSPYLGDRNSTHPKLSVEPCLMMGFSDGGTPFYLNPFVEDRGNTIILGQTGGGKSFLSNMMTLNWLKYPGARVLDLEIGKSSYVQCKAVGGSNYELNADQPHFQPLRLLQNALDFSWLEGWLEVVFSLNNVELNIERRKLLKQAMELVRDQHQKPTMTDLMTQIQDEELRSILSDYTINSQGVGRIFDADNEPVLQGRYGRIQLDAILSQGIPERFVIPALMYIVRFARHWLDGIHPLLIRFDEAFLLLSHDLLRDWLQEEFKTIRKDFGWILFSTQELQDITGSQAGETILSQCVTQIFLPDQTALSDQEVYIKRLGLSLEELRLLFKAVPRRDYYLRRFESGQRVSRLFRLVVGELELAICGAAGEEKAKEVDELIEAHGDEWLFEYLRQNDIPQAWLEHWQKGMGG
ncbi:probable conjugal transfer protein TrbE part 2 [Ylistrum balloti]|uniref:probable conjugal transfer protein TrbE part 2 n=1 Tax=Ylistrum balloti TaxID=509963 RepID=UPI002905E10D|nr:probable conjugal transfer protein TrbE part 2 [Ylistrum balloti]